MDKVEAVKEYISDKMPEKPKPTASFEALDLKGVSKDGVNYLAKVSVSNPYPTTVPIVEADYILKSEDRTILSGKMPNPGTVTRMDTTTIEVPLTIPHKIVASLVKDVLVEFNIEYELNIVLVIDVSVIGNLRIPISKKGHIKLPSIKDLFKEGDNVAVKQNN